MGESGGELFDRVFSLSGGKHLNPMVPAGGETLNEGCQRPVPPVALWPVWHRTERIRWLVRGRQRPGLLFRHVLAAAGDSARALLGAQDFGLAGFAAISLA